MAQLFTTPTDEDCFAELSLTIDTELNRYDFDISSFVNHFNLYSKRQCYIDLKTAHVTL